MRLFPFAFLTIICAGIAQAEVGAVTKLHSVRLYLPEARMAERVGDVQPLTDYIQSLLKEANAFWAASDPPGAKGILIAVGVRPDGKSRAWCDAIAGEIPPATLERFRAALEKVKPLPVKGGPIAFALELGLRGEMPPEFPVLPRAWTEAAKASKEPLVIPDRLFAVIWRD